MIRDYDDPQLVSRSLYDPYVMKLKEEGDFGYALALFLDNPVLDGVRFRDVKLHNDFKRYRDVDMMENFRLQSNDAKILLKNSSNRVFDVTLDAPELCIPTCLMLFSDIKTDGDVICDVIVYNRETRSKITDRFNEKIGIALLSGYNEIGITPRLWLFLGDIMDSRDIINLLHQTVYANKCCTII